jgi:TPR repeat protein
LSYCYCKGNGVGIDERKAFECIEKILEKDSENLQALSLLSDFYRRGVGTPMDILKASQIQAKMLVIRQKKEKTI